MMVQRYTGSITGQAKKTCDTYARIFLITGSDTAAMEICKMEKVGTSPAKTKQVLTQLRVQSLRFDQSYMSKNRTFAIIIRAMYDTFTIGEELTNIELQKKVFKIIGLDRSIQIQQLDISNAKTIKQSNKKRTEVAKKWLSYFFSVTSRFEGKKESRKYFYAIRDPRMRVYFYKKNSKTGITRPMSKRAAPIDLGHNCKLSV